MEEKEEIFDATLKKKKKKKNTSEFNPELEGTEPAFCESMEELSIEGPLKGENEQNNTTPEPMEDDLNDFSMMKKKKKPRATAVEETTAAATHTPEPEEDNGEETWHGSDRDYLYHELLSRV